MDVLRQQIVPIYDFYLVVSAKKRTASANPICSYQQNAGMAVNKRQNNDDVMLSSSAVLLIVCDKILQSFNIVAYRCSIRKKTNSELAEAILDETKIATNPCYQSALLTRFPFNGVPGSGQSML